jgi:putative mRNA 3-end processing factor
MTGGSNAPRPSAPGCARLWWGMTRAAVLIRTDRGLYCPGGDFFIDPWRAVGRALITHGHADHARAGHTAYLAAAPAVPVLRARLGSITVEGLDWSERRRIGDATVSFHPAGHVPGSAQIRIEQGGEVWVVSGDYKTEDDGLSEPFQPLRCHTFISECTFGLPVFRWAPQAEVFAQIRAWWAACAAQGRAAVLGAYSLGKAQRLIAALGGDGPVACHPAVQAMTRVLRDQGYPLPQTLALAGASRPPPGALVIAPPAALAEGPFLRRIGAHDLAHASGWMALRGIRRRRAAARGFVLSDHADWTGLNLAVADTGAERVIATHGYTAAFQRWLAGRGLDAQVLETGWTGEGEAGGAGALEGGHAQAQGDTDADARADGSPPPEAAR